MRVKRQKINRRTTRFYKTCCGFREPFKVLCDGTFLHYLLAHKTGPPADQLSRLLFASARPFTTRCVIAELKKLGKDFSETLALARKLDAAKCDHEPLMSAADCLQNFIADGNPEHFWVATQDAELRIKLRQAPAVPIILAQNNFLVLEPPSEKQQAVARASEAERTRASSKEFKIIKAREMKKEAALMAAQAVEEGLGEGMDMEQNLSLISKSNNDSDLKAARKKRSYLEADRPQFKRKRAKGPNPLSCKKKITKPSKAQKREEVQ